MADEGEDDSAKTEDPTQRKMEESRKRGQVAVSRELNTWLLLVASTLLIAAWISGVFVNLTGEMAFFLQQAHNLPTGPGGIAAVLAGAVWTTLKMLLPFLFALAVVAIIGPIAQAGPLWAPDLLKMDTQKISPIKGLQRLFSMKSIVEFLKGLIKLTVVSIVTYFVLKPYLGGIEHFVGMDMVQMMRELLAVTVRLLTVIAMVLFVFAGADVFYQRFDLFQRLKMTKQEIKDEYRQTEGDPIVRGRLKQLRLERARQRMMQNVPKADVVITNPTHFAVALQYDPASMMAPKVVAKGADDVAARIRKLAREHAVEIVENPPLARALFDKVDVDEVIPPDLYKAVAEIITYVFKKTGKMRT